MGIFTKPVPKLAVELETEVTGLRNRRDALVRNIDEAKVACEKSDAAWQAALGGDDSTLSKAGARFSEAQSLVKRLEAALGDHDRQIAAAETEFAAAKDRAAREAKANSFDRQMKKLLPLFDEYAEVSARFADELSRIEGVFDAQSAGSIARQTSEAIAGAKATILDQMRFTAAELRRNPPPRVQPPRLPAGVLPQWGIVADRNDPHEHPMLAPVGKRA